MYAGIARIGSHIHQDSGEPEALAPTQTPLRGSALAPVQVLALAPVQVLALAPVQVLALARVLDLARVLALAPVLTLARVLTRARVLTLAPDDQRMSGLPDGDELDLEDPNQRVHRALPSPPVSA